VSRCPVYIPDGYLGLDTPLASRWGFCSWTFWQGSYLWVNRRKRRVLISFIHAHRPGRGAFGRLVRAIESDGFWVAVPCPLYQMERILSRWGFRPHREDGGELGAVPVWERVR